MTAGPVAAPGGWARAGRMALRALLWTGITLAVVPPALCAIGFLLAHLYGCTGGFHLQSCRMAGMRGFVSPLLVMGWVSAFTVPVGLACLGIWAAGRWVQRRLVVRGGARAPSDGG